MGNCCATPSSDPGDKNNNGKNKKKNKKKQNPFDNDISYHYHNGNKLVVLKDPRGCEIRLRYELGYELGRGKFRVTYLCVDKEMHKEFACKLISKKKLRTAVDIEDVRREVQIMRHLPKHPNIVSLKDTYEDNNVVHLVMEKCKGDELFDQIVTRGRYIEAAITRTIVEVVQMCHRHGVMHQDLKPENFLFGNKKETAPLKAIDFGLSVFFKPKTEQGVAQAIIQSVVDFRREPWPKVSDNAKDLVKKMLDPDPKRQLSAQEVLDHPWLQNAKKARNVSLGETVRARHMKFSVMSKLKKRALRGDVGKDGYLDHGEFVAISIHLRKIGNDEHLHKAFQFFDKNRSGYIEIEELRNALADEVDTNSEEVIGAIMHDVDTNKDGRISYEEFAAMMKAGTDWRKASRQYSRERFTSLSMKLMKDGSLQLNNEKQ